MPSLLALRRGRRLANSPIPRRAGAAPPRSRSVGGLGLAALLALAGCGEREASPAAAISAEEAAAREDADHAASVARMEASYREAGVIARAKANQDITDSNAREQGRLKEKQGTGR